MRCAVGRRAGVVAACGITAGCLCTSSRRPLGSALLTSATAFAVLKWLGAAYLVYVGLRCCWPEHRILQI